MVSIPGESVSYWMESAAATSYPRLEGDVNADVVVIGGGMAGLCTAWELARTGRSVVVLDAACVAAGVSGHTTAKLTAQHGLIYAHLRSSFGAEAARLYARSQSEAMEHVAATAAELGADCQIERAPAYTYAAEARYDGDIREEVDAARAAGLDACLVADTGLPFRTGSAIRVADQVQFHPRRFLLALAEDLTRRHGRVYEHSRVRRLREGRGNTVTTETGATVTAGAVVIATHYPVFDRSLSFSRLRPLRELVIAGPVDEEDAPRGMYITPHEGTRSVRSAPYQEGSRLLIVTGEKYTPGDPGVGQRFDRLIGWARERFPVREITHHWATQDNWSTDRLPHVGLFHPATRNVYVATGFGGWGLSGGAMAGRMLADMIDAKHVSWAGLYDPRRVHPVAEASTFVKANLATARHFVADRLRPVQHDALDAIPPGGGAVLRRRGQHCAVYRDDEGALHAVSAVCSHLGCLVAFNEVERSWDCPCHGSRFDVDGAVLHGPATTPLESRDVGGE